MTEQEARLPVPLVVRRKRDGRCVYSPEARKALVELATQPGVSVSKLARQHDMNANVLRKWIDQSMGRGKARARQRDTGNLVPVSVTEAPAAQPRAPALGLSFIEVETDGRHDSALQCSSTSW